MYGSHRFAPPEPRPEVLPRPRLLRSLAGRWERRVTALVGGPGLGKTTLLSQAIAENRLAPRGEDVWVSIEPHDADADRLAHAVATALTAPTTDTPAGRRDLPLQPAAVADVVWRRSPVDACLVLDDVHALPPDSTGAAWLDDLVHTLPTNGHVVLASRSEPPLTLGRLGLQGAAMRLAEDDLRFSEDELSGFAARRGIDPRRFERTAGWPAMAELVAGIDGRVTDAYLWEEVLKPLGTLRRHVLAVLCDLGGADDDLASAALGSPIDLRRTLDDVPLISTGADGWHRPHGLWRTAPGLALDRAEREDVRRRAADHLARRGRFDDAFALLRDAQLWDAAPDVLRAACLESDRLAAGSLGSWLSDSSETLRSSSAGWLATGLYAAFTTPDRAVEPLRDAAGRCRDEGDLEGEVSAMTQIGRLAWWRQDHAALDESAARVDELAATGLPKARSLATLWRAMAADLSGHDDGVLAASEITGPAALDPASDAIAAWLSGVARVDAGDPDGALEMVDRLYEATDPAMRYVLESVRLWAWWTQGRVTEAIEHSGSVVRAGRKTGIAYTLYVGLTMASIGASHIGHVKPARILLDESLGSAPPGPDEVPVPTAIATASLQMAENDEAAAAATLDRALSTSGFGRGFGRRAWGQALSLSYVLVPRTRKHWAEVARRGHPGLARQLAEAVVAIREGRDGQVLRDLDLSDMGRVRTALHHRLAAELAVGLADVGRSEGRALLDALGPAGRTAVRDLSRRPGGGRSKTARGLLAAVPAPPRRSTYLRVLGPLAAHRDGPGGEEVVDPDLRRAKVQALVAFLVGHRRTHREAIGDALWPDLDDRSTANNLSVTLNLLLRLLEPWRSPGDPAYLLRLDGQSVRLVTGDHLRIDVDDFDRLLAAGCAAEADGTPSLALDHYLAALEIYRGDLHQGVPEADWLMFEREHYRSRFVTMAVRAGQLLLGRGDTGHAEAVAKRVLAADPWSEDAYAILVGGALARGDRSGAHRMLERCLGALGELGVPPSDTIHRLRRRVEGS